MMFVGRKNIVPPELDRKAGTCKYKMTDSSALLRRQVDKLVNVVLRKVFCEPTVHVQSWAGGWSVKQSGKRSFFKVTELQVFITEKILLYL